MYIHNKSVYRGIVSNRAANYAEDSMHPSLREKAFQTILKNRINRGGILAVGAGQIKNGRGD